MAFTEINSEDRLVQKTFADHLEKALGWESVYAWNTEVFGTPHPPLGEEARRTLQPASRPLPRSQARCMMREGRERRRGVNFISRVFD